MYNTYRQHKLTFNSKNKMQREPDLMLLSLVQIGPGQILRILKDSLDPKPKFEDFDH